MRVVYFLRCLDALLIVKWEFVSCSMDVWRVGRRDCSICRSDFVVAEAQNVVLVKGGLLREMTC